MRERIKSIKDANNTTKWTTTKMSIEDMWNHACRVALEFAEKRYPRDTNDDPFITDLHVISLKITSKPFHDFIIKNKIGKLNGESVYDISCKDTIPNDHHLQNSMNADLKADYFIELHRILNFYDLAYGVTTRIPGVTTPLSS